MGRVDPRWLLAALIWGVGGGMVWIHWTIERHWDGLVGKAERYRREARAARPAPWRPALPGDAWESYLPAMKQAWDATGGTYSWGALAQVDAVWDDAETEEARRILAEQQGILALLAEGARRIPDAAPAEEENDIRRARALGELARIDFLRRLQEGSPGEALEALEVLLKYAWDLAWTHEAPGFDQHGRELLETGLANAGRLLESGNLDAAQGRELCRILEGIDAGFPRMRPSRLAFLSRAAAVLRGLEDLAVHCGTGMSWCSRQAGWRHLWSRRLLRAATFGELEVLVLAGADADRLSLAEARVLEERLRSEVEGTKGVFTAGELADAVAPDGDISWRRLRMLVRIVRMAAIYRATGQERMLEDPGERWIRVTREGRDVVFGTVEPVSLQCRNRSAPQKFVVKVRR